MKPDLIRTSLVVEKEQFKKFRAYLALKGISVSEWVRKAMEKEMS